MIGHSKTSGFNEVEGENFSVTVGIEEAIEEEMEDEEDEEEEID